MNKEEIVKVIAKSLPFGFTMEAAELVFDNLNKRGVLSFEGEKQMDSNMTKTEKLRNILGKRVKFPAASLGYQVATGTVIAVYLENPCQKNELKIYCEELRGTQKYTYTKLSEVKEVKTIKAYAYRGQSTKGIYWYSDGCTRTSMDRVPEFDFEKDCPL